jgi:DNA-binding response OmpR family regulator
VLVIDDDPQTVIHLEVQLRALGHEVRSRPTLADGLLAAIEERADVLLVDVDLGGGHTADELVSLLDRGVGRPVVTCLLSADDTDELVALAARIDAAWLRKPVAPGDLAQIVAGGAGSAGSADGPGGAGGAGVR